MGPTRSSSTAGQGGSGPSSWFPMWSERVWGLSVAGDSCDMQVSPLPQVTHSMFHYRIAHEVLVTCMTLWSGVHILLGRRVARVLLCDHQPGHGLFVSRGGRETGPVSGRLPGGDRLAPSGCFTLCSLSLAGTLSKSSQP